MAAGYWNKSNTIEMYQGEIAGGAKAYFFSGGSLTPLVVYEDAGVSVAHSDPVVADAYGRWPDVFIPNTTTSFDVQILNSDDAQISYSLSVTNVTT